MAAVVFYLVLVYFDRKMVAAGGPSIVRFEFVWSRGEATRIAAEWGASGRDYARWSLWVDYLYMASYGTFFALACAATRDYVRERGLLRMAALGSAAAVAAVGAALCDAGENAFLLLTLGGHGGAAAPRIATIFASLKFLLIIFAVAYCVAGLVVRARTAMRRKAAVSG